MPLSEYRHQIIRLNGSTLQTAKYQLEICRINANGSPLQRAQWNFQTFRGLISFLQRHFPDSEILQQASNFYIQCRVVPTVSD